MKVAVFLPNIKSVCGRTKIGISLIRGLSNKGIAVFLITNPESDLNLCEDLNVETLVIPCNPFKKSLLNLLKCIKALRDFIEANQIDLINAHHRYAEFIILLTRFFFKLKVRVLSTVHSYTLDHKIISYRADKLIAVSNFIRNHLVNYYSRNNVRAGLIYSGIELNSQSKQNIVEEKKKIILGFGRLEYEKGFDILIDALNIIKNKISSHKLVLIGKGLEKNKLMELAGSYGIELEIFHYATTPWEYIKRASIVIIPSRVESFGIVILEAGLLGKCVIASNTGGIPEIIRHYNTGLLFENGNSVQLSEMLEKIVDDTELRHQFGYALKNKVANEFSYEGMVENYLSTFKQSLMN